MEYEELRYQAHISTSGDVKILLWPHELPCHPSRFTGDVPSV